MLSDQMGLDKMGYDTLNIPMYKIITMCIERVTALWANKHVSLKCALLFTIDKLMSGSSLERKAFSRTLKSKAFYFR